MNPKNSVAVGLVAAVLAGVLAPISTLTPAFAAEVQAIATPGSSSKTTDAFEPNPININVGDTVTWTNKDSTAHTVTSGTGPDDPDKGKAFDSSPNFNPLWTPGQTFSHTFETAGEFQYFCALHINMVGTVVVSEGGGNGGPTPFSVTAMADGTEYEITGTGTTTATAATINLNESVEIEFDGAGAVELTLPKAMIDDIETVNGEQATIVSEDDTSTTISFEVPEGETTVTIQAGFVVPEFPVIAAILAASLMAIIGYTRFAKSGTAGFFRRT